jgi:imidazolonepropionase-like amidohydrolase
MHPSALLTSGGRGLRRILFGAAGLAAVLSPPPVAGAQIGRPGVQRAAPTTYAITNARIVTGTGQVIDRGTVVVRGGLIAAVGPAVRPPADARVIDGSGLTVYPGIIDPYTNLGIPAPRQPQGGGGGQQAQLAALLGAQQGGPQGEQSAAPNSRYPTGLQPEVRAIDLVRLEGDPFESARGVGITAALTVPRSGIFMGQSSLIALGSGRDAQDILLRSPIALHVGFTPLRGQVYPGSLLGVFSSLRQMLLDAQRYQQMQDAYARNPRSMRRPDHDASLASLVPVLRRDMPVIMLASTQREIERALDLAKEFNIRAVIAGGNEAYLVADRLRAENVPVIATLNFPRRAQAPSAEAEPEPTRVLRERVEAPKNPGRLAQAGVRVALTSYGMSNLTEYHANLVRAVENGLSRDRAIRALTMEPAEILGVADRLGSIETGKVANLTIVRGDLFDRDSRVTQIFVDGVQMDVRPPQAPGGAAAGRAGAGAGAAGAGAGAPAAGAPAGISGQWNVTVSLEGEDYRITLSLQQDGERMRGGIQGPLGSSQIANASVGADGDLQFTVPITLSGTTEEAVFQGRMSEGTVRGTVTVVGHPTGTFVGQRPATPRQLQ